MEERDRKHVQYLIDCERDAFKSTDPSVLLIGAALKTLPILVIWAVVVSLVERLTDFKIGLGTISTYIAGIVTVVSFSLLLWRSYRSLRQQDDKRIQALEADLRRNEIEYTSYRVTDSKLFFSQNTDDLIHFLRFNTGEVFTLYDSDYEDWDYDDDPPDSLQIRSIMTVLKLPESGERLDYQFVGDDLDPGKPIPLGVLRQSWPPDEEFCDIPWDQLEDQLQGFTVART